MKYLSEITLEDALDHIQYHWERSNNESFKEAFDELIEIFKLNDIKIENHTPFMQDHCLAACLFIIIKYRLGLPKKGAN